MAYLLDANVFIEARRRYYGLDFCPAFWDWLIHENHGGRVFSIQKIADELKGHDDDLAAWAEERGDGFFLKPDKLMVTTMGKVSEWASGSDYAEAAVNEFLNAADYYLVSQALAQGHVVVTQEVPSPSKMKIKIPVACIALNVKSMNCFEMLRLERARFVLKQER